MHLQNNTCLQEGKYKILRFIGAGGFGCTYEGELVLLHKRVAIKEFFVKDFCNRDEANSFVTLGTQSKLKLVERLRRKFIEEAGALYSMQHGNIVRVTDVFEENGTAYYVMDYIDGISLQEMVKQEGFLSEEKAVQYIIQVADALKYVHSQNRLHLDIKPGNIMIDANTDKAILIDFGASKQYDEVDGENTSTLLGKTPGYAPIEQMSNNVKQFTPATDIYSLGATLFKLLTGETPPDATEIFNEGLPELPSNVSVTVREAVKHAMELRVKNRPQTIDEFLSLLVSQKETTDNKDTIKESCTDDDEATQLCEEYVNTSFDDDCAVDLGLSVKWCKYNLGAKRESDIGRYYGWGDIKGEMMEEDNSIYPIGNSEGTICDTEYDMAKAIMGGLWRLPTKMEQDELRLRCKWEWSTVDGVDGFKVTSSNGNSIFLPAAGARKGYNYVEQDSVGYYWSGDIHQTNSETAYYLEFDEYGRRWMNASRFMGFSVRPVIPQK